MAKWRVGLLAQHPRGLVLPKEAEEAVWTCRSSWPDWLRPSRRRSPPHVKRPTQFRDCRKQQVPDKESRCFGSLGFQLERDPCLARGDRSPMLRWSGRGLAVVVISCSSCVVLSMGTLGVPETQRKMPRPARPHHHMGKVIRALKIRSLDLVR